MADNQPVTSTLLMDRSTPIATDPCVDGRRALRVQVNNPTSDPIVSQVNLNRVASSLSAVQLVAANAGRLGLYVFNDATSNLYLKLGAGASSSLFSVKLVPGAYYELPRPFYLGAVSGIWVTAIPGDGALVSEAF